MNTFLLHLKNKLPAALSCKLFVLRFLQTGTTVDGQMTVVGMTAVGMPKVRSIQEITVHMNILKLSFFPSTIADWSVLAAEITCLRPKICIIYSQDVQQPSLGRFKVRFQKVSFGCHRIVFHRFFFIKDNFGLCRWHLYNTTIDDILCVALARLLHPLEKVVHLWI